MCVAGMCGLINFIFFQAEDGIRYYKVTGVQTCALPISMEAQRGSYSADYGDRTYGIFNVAPRTGFERDNEAELVLSAGNFYQTDDQLNFGGHTNRFGYYASLSGNRSNLGLQTPTTAVIHDAANGFGGFTSLIYNADSHNE